MKKAGPGPPGAVMEITASLPLMVIRHDAALACTRLPRRS